MSDRTLYRDADPNPEYVNGTLYPREAAAVQMWVVPVEPCVHGNYARHIIITSVRILDNKSLWNWCDGKPEADSG